MAIRGYSQTLLVDAYGDLSNVPAIGGCLAFASDTKTLYTGNGTSWIPGVNGNITPPAVVAGTGAGAGAVITLSGNNKNGIISLTQGTGGVASGQIMVLTLANNVVYPNKITLDFTPRNANFAMIIANLYYDSTANTATLFLNGLALTAGTVYIGSYSINGY